MEPSSYIRYSETAAAVTVTPSLRSKVSRLWCQLAGALAEEGCSLEHIVSRVREALKGIGELFFGL